MRDMGMHTRAIDVRSVSKNTSHCQINEITPVFNFRSQLRGDPALAQSEPGFRINFVI